MFGNLEMIFCKMQPKIQIQALGCAPHKHKVVFIYTFTNNASGTCATDSNKRSLSCLPWPLFWQMCEWQRVKNWAE